VALDIMAQAFLACPAKHAVAVAFSYFPTVARLLSIKLGNPEFVPVETFQKLMVAQGRSLPELLVTVALGNGFILTGMLWGAFLAELINRRLKISAVYLGILALFSFFGVVHSCSPDGNIYLPWSLTGIARKIPYQFALAYVGLAVMFLLLSVTAASREPPLDPEHQFKTEG
jgi:AGZA family xanthine/uracil permease-like MFS transporter